MRMLDNRGGSILSGILLPSMIGVVELKYRNRLGRRKVAGVDPSSHRVSRIDRLIARLSIIVLPIEDFRLGGSCKERLVGKEWSEFVIGRWWSRKVPTVE